MSRLAPFPSGAAPRARLLLVAGLILLAAAATAGPPDDAPHARPQAQSPPPGARPAARPPVRVYTNEDLERVHPFAAQTGVSSVPAVASQPAEPVRARTGSATRGRGEAYWRHEAERVRERQRALEERAAGLRARIVERERERARAVYGRRGGARESSSVDSLNAALAALERRIRLTQDDLAERARRDGALPGWLR